MLKRKSILVLLLFAYFSGHAQTDSIIHKTGETASGRSFLSSKVAAYTTPVVCVAYGFLAQENNVLRRIDLNIKTGLQEDYPGFKNHLDDKLQYMPVASVYALGFAGIKGRNNFIDKTALYFISNTIMSMSVVFIKTKTHKLRPDGSDHRALPSGHTATAFAAAEFMAQEYKDVSPWFAVAGYTMATATGTLRMLNNKHWFSDVVTGAGVGILSTKLAYLAYPAAKKYVFKKKTSKSTIIPGYQNGFWTFSAAYSLN